MALLGRTLKKENERLLQQFIEALSNETAGFSSADPHQGERYNQARSSKHEFARLYTPHYTTLKSARFHSLLHAIMEFGKRHVFIIPGPRGHGKSIQARIGKLQMILFGLKHYIMKGSETLKLAQKDISYIEAELRYNPRIREDFKIDFIVCNETELRLRITSLASGQTHFVMVEAISYGTPIIGSVFMQWRVDYMELDDFEDSESARSEKIAKKKEEWVMSQAFLALDEVSGILVWFGNNHAKTGAMNRAIIKRAQSVYIHESAYVGKSDCTREIQGIKGRITAHIFPAWLKIKSKRFALWPEKMNIHQLDELREDIGSAIFEAQMQQNPIEVGEYFNPDDVRQHYDQLPKATTLTFAGWIDQSLGEKKTSDFKSGWIVATDGRNYYIIDGFLRQMSIRKMVQMAYGLYEKQKPLGFLFWWIENNFQQYTLVSKRDFDDAAPERGYPLPIRADLNTLNKGLRIEALQPLFENHRILFPKKLSPDMERLIDHILGWPDFDFDDGPDGLSSAIEKARSNHRKKSQPGYKSLSKRRLQRRR